MIAPYEDRAGGEKDQVGYPDEQVGLQGIIFFELGNNNNEGIMYGDQPQADEEPDGFFTAMGTDTQRNTDHDKGDTGQGI